jgi:hypothetical protein
VRYLILLGVGLLFLIVMFLHPIGPALVLIAIVPFDAIFYALFGPMGNSITVILVLIFVVRTSPPLWSHVWLGTRIQRVIAVFALCLFVSHVTVIPEFGYSVLNEYAKKLGLFAMVGIVAWSFREVRFVQVCLRTFVVSMAVFSVLAALDYYLGIKILPAGGRDWGSEGALAQEITSETAWTLRFNPVGGMGVNRFANYLILYIFLSLGWFMSKDKRVYRMFALGCAVVMTASLLGTVSRSGIGGLVIGGLVLLPTIFRRLQLTQIALIAIVGTIVPILAWLVIVQLGLDLVVLDRFDVAGIETSGGMRRNLFSVAIELFLANPIIGVGESAFRLRAHSDLIAHNAYLSMLAERGLLGFVPYVIVLGLVIRQLLRDHSRIVPEMDHWRPFFLAGVVGMLVQINLNDFTWDRPLWFSFAFAAALERYETIAVQKRRSELMARTESSFDPPEPGFEPLAPPGSPP